MALKREFLIDLMTRSPGILKRQTPMLLALFVKILSAAASFGVTFLVAARYGPATVGTYALFTQSLLTFSMFAVFGNEHLVIRSVAASLANGQPERAYYFSMRGARSVMMFATLFALGFLIAGFSGLSLGFDPDLFLPLAIGLIANAVLVYGSAIIRAVDRVLLSQVLNGLTAFVMLAAVVALSLFDFEKPAITLSVLYTVAAVLIAVATTIIAYRKIARWPKSSQLVVSSSDQNQIKFGIISSLNFASGWFALYAVGLFFGEEAAGIFRVCLQFNMLLMMVITTYHGVSSPQFARLNALGNYTAMRRALFQSQLVLVVFCGLPAIVIIIFAPQILGLMGKDFVEGALTLRLLILATLITALTGSSGPLLNMSGREDIVLWLSIGAAITLITCVLVAASSFGIAAAAVAYLVSFAVRYVGIYVFAQRWLSARISEQEAGAA